MNTQELIATHGPREAMDYDVVVVGAGPAGLATAIRLKQLAPDASVVVLEKGSEPGASWTISILVATGGCTRRTNNSCQHVAARRAAHKAGRSSWSRLVPQM